MSLIDLETRTVSRKTPRDGRLEITDAVARRLAAGGAPLTVDVAGRTDTANVDTYECECRGPEHRHRHYFLQSELFRTLDAEASVDIAWDPDARRVSVRPSAPPSGEHDHPPGPLVR